MSALFPVALMISVLSSQLPSLPLVNLCIGKFTAQSGFVASIDDNLCFASKGGVVLLLRPHPHHHNIYDLIAMLGTEGPMSRSLMDLSIGIKFFAQSEPAPFISFPDNERLLVQYENWMPLLKELLLSMTDVLVVGVEMPAPMDVPLVISAVTQAKFNGAYIDIDYRVKRNLISIERLIKRMLRTARSIRALRLLAATQLEEQTITVQPLGPLTGSRKRKREYNDGGGPVRPPPAKRIDEEEEEDEDDEREPLAPPVPDYWGYDLTINDALPDDSVSTVTVPADNLVPAADWDDLDATAFVEVDDDDSGAGGNDDDGSFDWEEEEDVDMFDNSDAEDRILFGVGEVGGIVDTTPDNIVPNELLLDAPQPVVHVDVVAGYADIEDEEDEEAEEAVDEEVAHEVEEEAAMEEEEEEEIPIDTPVEVVWWDYRQALLDSALAVDNSVEFGALDFSAVPPTDIAFVMPYEVGNTLIDTELDNDVSVPIVSQLPLFTYWDSVAADTRVPDGADDDLIAFGVADSDTILSIDAMVVPEVQGGSDDDDDDNNAAAPAIGNAGGREQHRRPNKWRPNDNWKKRSIVLKGPMRTEYQNSVKRHSLAFKRRDAKKLQDWLSKRVRQQRGRGLAHQPAQGQAQGFFFFQ